MSDRKAGRGDLAAGLWFMRARVRILTEHQSTSVDPLGLRIFRPGEELEMLRWGRPWDEAEGTPWWTSLDMQGAHIVPAAKVQVLEVLEEQQPD
ncbi:hypothetical protein C3489_08050 [Streptomyces sp. Ru71]|uniref:hypothetical protein n=1 Tax=Streptomyces sp. Ru71 TaxID=2080746 RepID=UPI000CDE1829|nr:hypothetical protein [Streptomyces sp. Ru71]POX55812.1 hypothetical protein C3489_08050 [Streptomyces sp. Ru71]